MKHLGFVIGVVAVALAAVSADSTWPQFRGLQAGVAEDDPALPDTWSETQNVVWTLGIPGRSWSSPVVWDDHIFVTTATNTAGDEPLMPTSAYVPPSSGGSMTRRALTTPATALRWVVYDIDFETGKVRWEREVARGLPARSRHQKNTYATETPVTDGERVYAYFGNVGLFAFDMDGTPVWSKPISPVDVRTGFGSAASPVLHDDRVIVVSDNEGQSYIAAYDTASGRELWRTDRQEGSNWATPYVWQNDRRTELVTAGTDRVRAYDLDGKLLWELSGMSTFAIPTPIAADGLLYITSGYPGDQLRPVYAIRSGATGDISLKSGQTSNDFIVWSDLRIGGYHPSPLVFGGCYYTLIDRGFLTCHDPKTGAEIYGRQRISSDATGFTASPWAYNGKIFALSEDGDTYVVQAGPEFKVIGRNAVGEMTLATPAIANGSLIIRTASTLYRIGT